MKAKESKELKKPNKDSHKTSSKGKNTIKYLEKSRNKLGKKLLEIISNEKDDHCSSRLYCSYLKGINKTNFLIKQITNLNQTINQMLY